ncbi:tripartite motif-containing protein 59-like [Watersipora subatra]|uniref:tripartite motif-containing protein 59-like n=1 Tax=Watersipora subatra TaxID=2589382 RepID=UPI00355BAF41
MADRDLIGDSRCGYCYQEFSLMRDPRELPCHHAFCLECLKGDYKDQKIVSCPLCNKMYESEEDIDKLPTVKLTAQKEDNPNTTATALICECDECDNQLAVCYCFQCCRKICAVHKENHAIVFKRGHSIVDIPDYEVSATKSRKVVCEIHDEELSRGCDDCGRLTCNKCEIPPVACTSLKYEHNFMVFSQLKEKITTEFDELLQLVNDKLTEICVVDKQIWHIFDKEEAKCKEKIELIERVCEEQIKRISEESENLKERIHDYQKRLTNQVGIFSCELVAKKQQLEESRTKVHRHLKDSHVTELRLDSRNVSSSFKSWLSEFEAVCELTSLRMGNTEGGIPLFAGKTKLLALLGAIGSRGMELLRSLEFDTVLGTIPGTFKINLKEDMEPKCSLTLRPIVSGRKDQAEKELNIMSASESISRSGASYAGVVKNNGKVQKVSILNKVNEFLDEIESDNFLDENKFEEKSKSIRLRREILQHRFEEQIRKLEKEELELNEQYESSVALEGVLAEMVKVKARLPARFAKARPALDSTTTGAGD